MIAGHLPLNHGYNMFLVDMLMFCDLVSPLQGNPMSTCFVIGHLIMAIVLPKKLSHHNFILFYISYLIVILLVMSLVNS